jgi:predicted SnoaL-like aldol condensation-catalyzing enzyme
MKPRDVQMKAAIWITTSALFGAALTLAAEKAPLGFLERSNLSTPQDKPFVMPATSQAVRDKNKQVVLDFYKVISDKRQWTDDNRKKYFHDDFIQHDPAEPDTSEAFFSFFRSMGPPGGVPPAGAVPGGAPPAGAPPAGAPRGPMMRMPGVTSNDSNGSPVNWMVAEGDYVVVVRHRNWNWEGGPTASFNGIFVDVWHLVNGKIKEQWCSATPADANLNKINSMLKDGKFPKRKSWD